MWKKLISLFIRKPPEAPLRLSVTQERRDHYEKWKSSRGRYLSRSDTINWLAGPGPGREIKKCTSDLTDHAVIVDELRFGCKDKWVQNTEEMDDKEFRKGRNINEFSCSGASPGPSHGEIPTSDTHPFRGVNKRELASMRSRVRKIT